MHKEQEMKPAAKEQENLSTGTRHPSPSPASTKTNQQSTGAVRIFGRGYTQHKMI